MALPRRGRFVSAQMRLLLRTIDMRTFVVLTRTRNFRRAAEELNTTQPAISNRLTAIESEYGCRLIERGDGVFRLTSEGEQVLKGFEAALGELDRVSRSLSGVPVPRAEPLKIGAIDTVAATWMPELIERLHGRFPDLQIELTVDGTAPLLAGLKTGRFEVVFAIQPMVDEGFRSFSPCVLQMIWAGSPRLIDPERDFTPRDIAKLPIISFPKGTPPYLMIAPYFHDEQVLASNLTSCNSLYAIVSLLIDGFGVASLPAVVIRRELKSGQLRPLKVTKRFPSMPVVASYQALTHQDMIRTVVEMSRTVASEFCARAEPGTAWVE
ncbi:MAG: transcriptional regulator [Alphaproteobacteria bacterium]|nr:MAG: transcriptional regulator [Alphaproteobacteria bacterium]